MRNLTEWKAMNNSSTSNSTAQISTKPSNPSISNNIKNYLYNFEKLAKYLESLGGWTIVDTTSTRLEAHHAYDYFMGTLVIYYDQKYKAFTTTLEDTTNKRILKSVTCLDDWNTLLSILEREGIIKDKTLCEDIENNKGIPKKLYHATYKQFLKSIQNKGLGNTKRKMWEDSKQGIVYLANDPWVAESYAEESECVNETEDPDKYLDNIIILEIDTSKLNADKFFIDENVQLEDDEENTTWEYHGIIPWEVCKIFNSSSDLAEEFREYENLWDNLNEWKALNNSQANVTSNNSSTQPNNYKNRFKKLVSYAQAHAAPILDKSEVELLDTHALHYKQYFKSGGGINWTSTIIINISRFDTKWTIKHFIDDDFKDSRTGNDYNNLIRALSFYINLPNPGTSDYDDLLVESINNITEEFKDYENLLD